MPKSALPALGALVLLAASGLQAQRSWPDGQILARSPCFSDSSYEKALTSTAAKIAARGGDVEEVEETLRSRWPEEIFAFLTQEVAGEPVCQRIFYASDGLRVAGYLVRPAAKPEATEQDRDPVIIFNRGGNREFGKLTLSSLFGLVDLAQRGYAILASQYRGNDGGEGREEFGGADVHDVLNLIPLVDSLSYADPDRIGMFGWSRGGMMTYLALKQTDRIRAAVVGAGMADAFNNVARRPDMEAHVFAELVPNWEDERKTALAARSAVRWAGRLHKETPILLLHGSADWRVHPTEALDMARALYEARHPFRFAFFEGGDHGLSEFRDEVDEMIGEWFDRYLRDRQAWPSLKPHGR